MVSARRPKSCLFRLYRRRCTQRFPPLAAHDRPSLPQIHKCDRHMQQAISIPSFCLHSCLLLLFSSFLFWLLTRQRWLIVAWWSCPVKARAHSSSRPFQFDVCRNVTAKSKNSKERKQNKEKRVIIDSVGNSGSEKVKCIIRYLTIVSKTAGSIQIHYYSSYYRLTIFRCFSNMCSFGFLFFSFLIYDRESDRDARS